MRSSESLSSDGSGSGSDSDSKSELLAQTNNNEEVPVVKKETIPIKSKKGALIIAENNQSNKNHPEMPLKHRVWFL